MKPRSPRTAAVAALAAVAVAGCGEVENTITAPPGTANHVKLVLAGAPNAFYAGIYEAQRLGYFKQADLDVRIVVPTAGEDPLTMVHNDQALIGVSSEVDVLLHRNQDEPVVGVAALVHGPLTAITIKLPKAGATGGVGVTTTSGAATSTTSKATTTPAKPRTTVTKRSSTSSAGSTTTTPAVTTTTASQPDATLWPPQLRQLLSTPGTPSYDGLVLVVRKDTIVDDAQLPRRVIQAIARGYRAARANPTQAIANLIAAVPALAPQRALQLATLKAAIPYFFPHGLEVWGWLRQADWNSFGTWLSQQRLLTNPHAVTDAVTNELLQGQGV